MKTYATLSIARMQAGSKTKKTGVKHEVKAHEGVFYVGTPDDLATLVKEVQHIELTGKYVNETKCFVCFDHRGKNVWFHRDEVESYKIEDGMVTVVFGNITSYRKKQLGV